MAGVNAQLAKHILTLIEKQTGFDVLKEICEDQPALLQEMKGLTLSTNYTEFFDQYSMYVVEKLNLALDQCGENFECIKQRSFQSLSSQSLILYVNSAVKWLSELYVTPGLGQNLFQTHANVLRYAFVEILPEIDRKAMAAYSEFEYKTLRRRMDVWEAQLSLDKMPIAS